MLNKNLVNTRHVGLKLLMLTFMAYSLIINSLVGAEVDSLMTLGDSLLNAKDYTAAKKNYQAALKINNTLDNAFSKLGLIAYQEEDWGDVKKYFQKVLDKDPENLQAHYYKGISYRETGKFKALLMRRIDWNKSENHFQRILSQDSLYRDVLYQYAKLKRYRGKYEDAVRIGHEQIRLKPEMIKSRVKIFRLYRYLITHRKLDEAINWLSEQHWDHSRYFIGEAFRREGNLTEADSIFQNLLKNQLDMPLQPLLLSLARTNYEKMLPQASQKFYWWAVDSMSETVEADLVLEDLKYLLTDQELAEYRSLKKLDEKIAFFHRFWTKRDPTPAAIINIRLAEHYRRMLYAEKHYEYDGFRTWFLDPDELNRLQYPEVNALNQEFNDKGLIYIRHGEPDDRVTTLGEDIPFNESWQYYRTLFQPEMTFHFISATSGNDWRFAPIINHPAMLADRVGWGNIYFQLLRATDLEQLPYQEEMADNSRQSVMVGLSSDRHRWGDNLQTFNIPFMLDSFRGEDGKTLLELSYALPILAIVKEQKNDTSEIKIEKGVAIYDSSLNEISKDQEYIDLSPATKNDYLGLRRYLLHPGMFTIALHARIMDLNLLGGWKFLKDVEDYHVDSLKISDIQLASFVEVAADTSQFSKNGLLVYPNPTRKFFLNAPIHVYFEVYNLFIDSQGSSYFTIEYDLSSIQKKGRGITNLFGLLGGGAKKSITIQNEREGKQNFSCEYLAIDASNLDTGSYELTISVRDKHQGEVIQRSENLTLQKSE